MNPGMMLFPSLSDERSAYDWLRCILTERYGLDLRIEVSENYTSIRLAGMSASITLPRMQAVFRWGTSNLPVAYWHLGDEGFATIVPGPLPSPGFNALPSPLVLKTVRGYHLQYDLFGFLYWMLNRLEEINRHDLDSHSRFPASASHAYKFGYLDRPLVDEWLHVLGQIIQLAWPGVEQRSNIFSMLVSHDVDNPSRYAFADFKSLTRAVVIDAVKYRAFRRVVCVPLIRMSTRESLSSDDPYNTFDWIMDQSESRGMRSAFYFICGGQTSKDADYDLAHPAIRALLREIHKRGHEIGLHPSYATFDDPDAILTEANTLRRLCQEEGILQTGLGGRMHYLRWSHPTTLLGWEAAGMTYDSTLGYADRPGFRCGTCHEYPAFDPVSYKQLNIRIRPLVAMESTVIATRYMNLGYTTAALETFLNLKRICRRVGGRFTLLWHNSHFMTKDDRQFYCDIIDD